MTHLGNPGWSYIAIFNLITFAKVLCQIRSYSQFPWIKMWTYLLGAHRLNPYRSSNVFQVLLCKCFNSENLNISFRLKSGSEFESKHNTETEQEAISGCARKWKSHELRSTFWMYTPLGYFFLHRRVGLGPQNEDKTISVMVVKTPSHPRRAESREGHLWVFSWSCPRMLQKCNLAQGSLRQEKSALPHTYHSLWCNLPLGPMAWCRNWLSEEKRTWPCIGLRSRRNLCSPGRKCLHWI